MAVIDDEFGSVNLDGCESCGDTSPSPYYKGHGFLCHRCMVEVGACSDDREVWAPHPTNRREILPGD